MTVNKIESGWNRLCGIETCDSFVINQFYCAKNVAGYFENVSAQELLSKSFEVRFMNKKFGEIDFIIQNNRNAVPLEIKSGTDYKKHAALNNVLSVDEWNLKEAIASCLGNLEQEQPVTYLPWYMIIFLKRNEIQKNTIFEVSLNGI